MSSKGTHPPMEPPLARADEPLPGKGLAAEAAGGGVPLLHPQRGHLLTRLEIAAGARGQAVGGAGLVCVDSAYVNMLRVQSEEGQTHEPHHSAATYASPTLYCDPGITHPPTYLGDCRAQRRRPLPRLVGGGGAEGEGLGGAQELEGVRVGARLLSWMCLCVRTGGGRMNVVVDGWWRGVIMLITCVDVDHTTQQHGPVSGTQRGTGGGGTGSGACGRRAAGSSRGGSRRRARSKRPCPWRGTPFWGLWEVDGW